MKTTNPEGYLTVNASRLAVQLCFRAGRLLTGGGAGAIKLWSVGGVVELPLQQQQRREGAPPPPPALTMDDELSLDGAVISAVFDDTLDMVSFL